MYTLIHNSNCSKSNAAFEWLTAQHIPFEVRNYLTHPLDQAEILALVDLLQVNIIDLVRTTDTLWQTQYADVTAEATILDILVKEPSLIQRPILVSPTAAAIGRPLERIIALVNG